MHVCILPNISVSVEICIVELQRYWSSMWVPSPPVLQSATPVHSLNPVHKLKPMHICYCPLRKETWMLWLVASGCQTRRTNCKVIVSDMMEEWFCTKQVQVFVCKLCVKFDSKFRGRGGLSGHKIKTNANHPNFINCYVRSHY